MTTNKQCKITLPTVDDWRNTPARAAIITDFAIANGAKQSDLVEHDNAGNKLGYTCDILTCQMHEGEGGAIITIRNDGNVGWAFPNRGNVIAPRIINPEAGGFSTIKFDDNERNKIEVLTLNGEVVLYPRSIINTQNYAKFFDAKQNGVLSPACTFTSDAHTHGEENKPFKAQINEAFFAGDDLFCQIERARIYSNSIFQNDVPCIKGKEYWLSCEPIRAKLCRRGEIQITEGIINCQFEPRNSIARHNYKDITILDTDEFSVGRFLNNHFLKDLRGVTAAIKRHREEKSALLSLNNSSSTAKKIRLTTGARVKIKCEGSFGTVKSIDPDAGTATLSVDGKRTPLKYRLSDLLLKE